MKPEEFKPEPQANDEGMELVKYEPWHLMFILNHPSQALVRKFVKESDAISLQRHEYCFSILKNGSPIASIGLMKYWNGRYEAWAFIIPGHRSDFLYIHNCVKQFLKHAPCRRIEMTVEQSYPQGHRWAKLLGFKVECERLESFGPQGGDHKLYVRIREDL